MAPFTDRVTVNVCGDVADEIAVHDMTSPPMISGIGNSAASVVHRSAGLVVVTEMAVAAEEMPGVSDDELESIFPRLALSSTATSKSDAGEVLSCAAQVKLFQFSVQPSRTASIVSTPASSITLVALTRPETGIASQSGMSSG